MLAKLLEINITKSDRIMIVSDIHLRLPITSELVIIQNSLVSRIRELSSKKDAILVLNGDIFELWEQTDQTVSDIIAGFSGLTEAITSFARNKSHRVIYTVGNHDDLLLASANDRAIVHNQWQAELTSAIDFKIGRKTIRVEHGHEYDPYSQTAAVGEPKGKKLVQKTLPMLEQYLPSLFIGLGNGVDRALLAGYVIGNLGYKLVVPYVVPLVIMLSTFMAVLLQDTRYIYAQLIVLALGWVVLIMMDWMVRVIGGLTLGGGASYMSKVDKYHQSNNFTALVLGHTHHGKVTKRRGYIYANSGCNDTIAVARIGWLGLPKFNQYLQLSDIVLDYSQKEPIKYHEEIITLVK